MYQIVKYFDKNSDVLTKVRLWLYSIAYLHLATLALIMFCIDFRTSADPKVWVYQDLRFKLITCWFNLLCLAYLPTSIYCEWRRLNSKGELYHVKMLNRIRHTSFTSILLPTTVFSDLLFWRLWNKDRELIAPAAVDEFAPFWTQHCMHTVSLVVVVLDLILCPRKKPKNLTLGIYVMHLFLGAYTAVCVHAILQGQYIYPVFELLSTSKLCILVMYVYLEHYFYYTLQWHIIDLLWGNNNTKSRRKMSSFIPVCGETAFNKFIPLLRLTKSAANTQS